MIKKLVVTLGLFKTIMISVLSFFTVAVAVFLVSFVARFYAWAAEAGWEAMKSLGF